VLGLDTAPPAGDRHQAPMKYKVTSLAYDPAERCSSTRPTTSLRDLMTIGLNGGKGGC
jgi:hypothetical protein